MIRSTRLRVMLSFSPAISIVPPKRSDVPMGVIATRASERMVAILGIRDLLIWRWMTFSGGRLSGGNGKCFTMKPKGHIAMKYWRPA